MRSYNEFCSVAKALDTVGDRWTLLIIRELLLRDRLRYTDLRAGLPGIATNLLAERLRELEAAGLVTREEAPPPIATTLFSLTPRGRELDPVLQALGRWGVPMMADGPGAEDEFRSHWLIWPVETFLRDRADLDGDPLRIALRVDGDELLLELGGGEATVTPGHLTDPDATLSGPPYSILALICGGVEPAAARELGLAYEGDPAVLERLRGA